MKKRSRKIAHVGNCFIVPPEIKAARGLHVARPAFNLRLLRLFALSFNFNH